MDAVLEQLGDDDERSRVFHQCLKKGGKDIYSSTLPLAVLPDGASVAVFHSSSIPVPRVDVVDSISNVRFDTDLSDLPSLSMADAEEFLSFQASGEKQAPLAH